MMSASIFESTVAGFRGLPIPATTRHDDSRQVSMSKQGKSGKKRDRKVAFLCCCTTPDFPTKRRQQARKHRIDPRNILTPSLQKRSTAARLRP